MYIIYNDKIEIYNDGILLFSEESIEDLKDIINILIKDTEDKWEVELLSRILYTLNTNRSTTEVA